MYDPISGNAAYAKYSPVTLPPIGQRAGFAEVSVKLNPHTSQPELITLSQQMLSYTSCHWLHVQ